MQLKIILVASLPLSWDCRSSGVQDTDQYQAFVAQKRERDVFFGARHKRSRCNVTLFDRSIVRIRKFEQKSKQKNVAIKTNCTISLVNGVVGFEIFLIIFSSCYTIQLTGKSEVFLRETFTAAMLQIKQRNSSSDAFHKVSKVVLKHKRWSFAKKRKSWWNFTKIFRKRRWSMKSNKDTISFIWRMLRKVRKSTTKKTGTWTLRCQAWKGCHPSLWIHEPNLCRNANRKMVWMNSSTKKR